MRGEPLLLHSHDPAFSLHRLLEGCLRAPSIIDHSHGKVTGRHSTHARVVCLFQPSSSSVLVAHSAALAGSQNMLFTLPFSGLRVSGGRCVWYHKMHTARSPCVSARVLLLPCLIDQHI